MISVRDSEGAALRQRLTAQTFKQPDALVPLFLDDGIRLQQIGSGVAIRLANDELFILTAAHVTDLVAKGTVCLPMRGGIEPIKGMYGGIRLPHGSMRGDDTDDVSYIRLDPACAEALDSRITPLEREDVHLHETLVAGDVYSFGGYPLSKSDLTGMSAVTEAFMYSGGAAEPIKYKNLGYNAHTHILINFNRKKSLAPDGTVRMPPHPRGISGGGVFAWPKDWVEKQSTIGGGHLVAIGHSYLEKHHCLVGTRIHLHLSLIANAFPELIDNLRLSETAQGIPMFRCMVWYRRDEWQELRKEMVDADKYPASWNEWRRKAETGLESTGMQGLVMVPIDLSRAEIASFCQMKHRPNDSQARLALANLKLARQIQGGHL